MYDHEPSPEYVAHARARDAHIQPAAPTAEDMRVVTAALAAQKRAEGTPWMDQAELAALFGVPTFDDLVLRRLQALNFPFPPQMRLVQERTLLGKVVEHFEIVAARYAVEQWLAGFRPIAEGFVRAQARKT